MKLWVLLVLLIAAAGLPLGAQSNQVLDELLEREALQYGEAAYLVLVAVERLPEDASLDDAAAALPEEFGTVRARGAEEAIPLGDYAFLLMQAFEINGGIMYRLAPGPRYAARELAYRKVIRGKAHPGRSVSGTEAVQILRRLLEWKEGLS